jgi:glycerol-3-phosphate acyltransferase PlsY
MLDSLGGDPTNLALTVAFGYFLGSIPFGLVLTRIAGLGDIRNIGSGSIGATNVLRTGNKVLAALTVLLDGGKGAVAAIAAWYVSPELAPVAAVAAVLGHLFPIWLGFQGGKGVATTLGALAALSWPVGLSAGLTWLVVAFIFRFSSLSGLISVALAPAYAWYWSETPIAIAAAILAVFVWYRHKANIQRLLSGEEPKIGKKN